MSKSWDRVYQAKEKNQGEKLRRYLIVSEDEKSSLLYLKAFPVDRNYVEIVTEGGCGNTVGVLDRGLELREEAENKKTPYAQTFCVIDRDEHDENRYATAFSKARKYNDVTVIWANQAFELWYLLHFEFTDSPHHRKDLNKKVAGYLGKKYAKNDASIYENLKKNLPAATKNSETLEARHRHLCAPYLENPSTNIHRLVKVLQDLERLSSSPQNE